MFYSIRLNKRDLNSGTTYCVHCKRLLGYLWRYNEI